MENETSKPDETKALQLEDEFFDEDYDEIDKEYQSCSKCGWEPEEEPDYE